MIHALLPYYICKNVMRVGSLPLDENCINNGKPLSGVKNVAISKDYPLDIMK